MLFKKFSSDVYQKLQPEYKTYQTDNGKESLLISKNYTVVKQGKWKTKLIGINVFPAIIKFDWT